MTLPFTTPPENLCLLRLSAIGDVCHMLPIVRTIQHAWPQTRLTWIIGKTEYGLVAGIPGIEFLVLDKAGGWRGYAALRRRLRGRRFGALLHMQLSLRASLASLGVASPVRLGFDRARARELQWLVTNHRVALREREHVQDGFFGFTEALGIRERVLRWDIPIPGPARAYAERAIPDGRPTLAISPCSSHPRRNWRAEHYAQVADYAAETLGLHVLLCGGRSALEREMGAAIEARMRRSCDNLIGKDTLIEFLATLGRAAALLTPDSGPAHMATAVGTPVIGLYAATNPARTGPYLSRQWCVDRYDAAARTFCGKPAAQLPWTAKIERDGVMDLITPRDVIEKLDALWANLSARGIRARAPGE
jgi:heptosyltransferase I